MIQSAESSEAVPFYDSVASDLRSLESAIFGSENGAAAGLGNGDVAMANGAP